MIKRAFDLLLEYGKKAKKLPKLLLQGPKLIASVLGRIASKTAILPLNTFSGKVLFITLYLLIVTAGSGLVYVVDGVETAWTVFRHAGVGTAAFGITFLVSYPLDRWGYIEAFLVGSGIRQRMRISTRAGALFSGLVTAVGLTVAVEYTVWLYRGTGYGLFAIGSQRRLLWPEWILGVVFAVGFIGGALTLLLISRRKTRTLLYEDMTVVDVIDGDEREAILRNDGDSVISIVDAKVRDADGGIYALNANLRIRPGEKISVTLPDGFVLESESDDSSVEGFYERHVTSIYSKTGDTYVVKWGG